MAISGDSGRLWLAGFKTDYKHFCRGLVSHFGSVLLVMVIIGLMITVCSGACSAASSRGFNTAIGLGPLLGVPEKLDGPLLHRLSLMNITLVIGAFCAALLSGKFFISRPPKLEYIWAALGGSFMGLGATLAGGCTTGGFFTPVMHSSPTAWAMLVGLLLGALIGLKLLFWTLDHIQWGIAACRCRSRLRILSIYPPLGLGVGGNTGLSAQWYTSVTRN